MLRLLQIFILSQHFMILILIKAQVFWQLNGQIVKLYYCSKIMFWERNNSTKALISEFH